MQFPPKESTQVGAVRANTAMELLVVPPVGVTQPSHRGLTMPGANSYEGAQFEVKQSDSKVRYLDRLL